MSGAIVMNLVTQRLQNQKCFENQSRFEVHVNMTTSQNKTTFNGIFIKQRWKDIDFLN